MARAKTLLKNERFRLTLDRLCYEIIENYPIDKEKCIIGIQERGVYLAERIVERLTTLEKGSTIHAAMSALQDFGRPAKVELLVMVDRRFNRHLPIQANYTGLIVDAYDEAYVKVEYNHIEAEDRILLYQAKSK